MDSIADRVKLILKTRGWSQRELSRRAGLAETSLGSALRNASDIGIGTATALAKAANVSFKWLATGEGTMERDDSAAARVRSIEVEIDGEIVTLDELVTVWRGVRQLKAVTT